MFNQTVLTAVTFLYIVCAALYFSNFFLKIKTIGRSATFFAFFAFLIHTAALVIRWVETYKMGFGHLHIVTLYESLIFISWSIMGGYLFVERLFKNKGLGGFVVPIGVFMMIYASMVTGVDSGIKPVPEVLQGNFYNYHVIPCFLAYAAFALSCGASIIFLFKKKGGEPMKGSFQLFPSPVVLDEISYKTIAVGFIFFTIQLVAGMFRTNIIWGSYWEWDPTQVFGLMTWLIYATILHGRYMQWWDGYKTSFLSIIGFITAVIGFLAATGRMIPTGHYPIG
jgi:cytochrome c-type biogenesis protein CcsB